MSNPIDSRSDAPHVVDIHVGGRIRLRRKALGLSQTDLADKINLTFQQIQKYERGYNRVSASKLYEISRALMMPVAYFFEGYNQPGSEDVFSSTDSEQAALNFLGTNEGLELATAFPRIQKARHRRRILDLVRALGDED